MGTSSGGGIGEMVSFKAESDLSGRQFRGVRVTAANTVGTSYISGTDYVIGVLQNKPSAAGVPADIQINGISKVVTSGTCDAGQLLVCGSDARFRAVLAADIASTNFTVRALEAASATVASGGGDIISAEITKFVGTTS